ncbi:hypothetical protein HZC09_01070 [Candidatus Micrarchaeota archaeon]|nr:hypothetical protein [Candidatus Micrarchaeota archaeon]
MSVFGDQIICNCKLCYQNHGYGIPLAKKGDLWVCEHDSSHRYVIRGGYTHRA